MYKNSPINSVYLVALACASLVMFVDSVYSALVFASVVIGVFLIAISVVSMIEKIADKHVKYICFALISAALVTIIKVIFNYVNISFIVLMADYIDIAIVPCLLMAVVPIYFEDAMSAKAYFVNSLLMSLSLFLMLSIYGIITEIFGYGSFTGKILSFEGLEFFRMPYGSFMVISTLAIIFNFVRRAYIKEQKRFRTLVDKYKIQILEIRSSSDKPNKIQKDNGGNK